MKLLIASNNAHKIDEIKSILGGFFSEIVSLREAGIDHETIEDGTTFMENAHKKAREAALLGGCYALADDSGICVDALGGAPGIYSARFSGEHGNDCANNYLMLEKLQGNNNRAAHYSCAVCIAHPNGTICAEAYGELHGTIAIEPSGIGGFGYDPLFYLPDYGCTVACLKDGVKNQISHRHQALVNLLEILQNCHLN